MKPVVAIAAVLPAASALRPRRLQNSMPMDPGLPLTELPIPSPGYPPCNICGEGGVITNPGAVLQIDGIIEGKTCAEFDTDGENGLISESECVLLPLETIFACDCQFDGIDPVPPPPPPPSQESCSCSPRDFTFQLQLDRDCDTNTINGSPGVEIAVCNRRGGAGVTDFSTLEIVDIQFLELNGLTVINQNDTFTNTSLVSGDTFSFPSISGLLSPGTPIGEQAQYFPTEVTLSLEGKVKDDDGNEVAVRNQVAWSYTEDCNILPISVGQSIGWVDIVSRTHRLSFFTFFIITLLTEYLTLYSYLSVNSNNRLGKKTLHQTFAQQLVLSHLQQQLLLLQPQKQLQPRKQPLPVRPQRLIL